MTVLQQPADLDDAGLRARAVAAARGDARFDVLVAGGTVVDVVTGECRAADVGIVGALIASVHAPGRAATRTRSSMRREPTFRPALSTRICMSKARW